MKSLKYLVTTIIITQPIFSVIIDVSIGFAPTHNIGINQLAYYRCWSNHTMVHTQWLVVINGTEETSTTHFPDMVENGTGTPNSSLTIPGYPQYNNTIVICLATGDVDGTIYQISPNATLRIQGCFFNFLSLMTVFFLSH